MLVQRNKANNKYSNFSNQITEPKITTSMCNSINNNLQRDTFIQSNKSRNIAFGSYKGYGWYGSQSDRAALQYKIQLTPTRISDIVETVAKCRDHGIVQSYMEFCEESKRVGQALQGMGNIIKEFKKVGGTRLREIAGMKLEAPMVIRVIPLVNLIPSFTHIDDVEAALNDVQEDSNGITRNYWNNGLLPMVEDYYTTADALHSYVKRYLRTPDDISYHNLVLRKSNERYIKMDKNIKSAKKQVGDKFGNLLTDLNNTSSTFSSKEEEIFNKQKNGQVKRFFAKAVLAGLDCGLGDYVMDHAGILVKSDAFGDLLDAVNSTDLDLGKGLDSGGEIHLEEVLIDDMHRPVF